MDHVRRLAGRSELVPRPRRRRGGRGGAGATTSEGQQDRRSGRFGFEGEDDRRRRAAYDTDMLGNPM